MTENTAWWEKEARVWREAAEGHLADSTAKDEEIERLLKAMGEDLHERIRLQRKLNEEEESREEWINEAQYQAKREERERVREALGKLPRFDPEKDDSGSEYALGQLDPIMVEYDDGLHGDWLRRADALAALDSEGEQ